MKKKTILFSVLTIALCLSLIAGSTFALFTSEDEVNIAVTAATVKVTATVVEDSLELYSMGVLQEAGAEGNHFFENGGTAVLDAADPTEMLTLTNITPGDKVTFEIDLVNDSNVTIKYCLTWAGTGDLYEKLVASAILGEDENAQELVDGTTEWTVWETTDEKVQTVTVSVELPADVNDDFKGKEASISFSIEAVQGNAPEVDEWDGTTDTEWYDETATEFKLDSAEQVAGLITLVDGGNTFEGKTITLESDMDLYVKDENGNRVPFSPIGHSANGKAFKGVFDGQGHTISNLYQQSDLDAWQYEGEYYGLFAYTDGATIKNVTIADAYISSGRNEAAGVVGNAVDTTFSDITISNTTLIAYNNSAGGVAAECYGNCSFTNITVDEDTVIGPLWGTYDVRLGGVVGMVSSTDNVTFSNITVACQLDAINDVASNYQWYNYRYSGMLIGHVDGVNGVADPTGYVTCENVTVIYGDWVNYHYCEDSSYGTPSYASAGQYKFNRVEAGTGTNGIDLSTCDHDETETHNLLIVFDQLFGGGQGVAGLKTYPGVTVNYPASYNPENN